MGSTFIFTYSQYSEGADNLKDALGIKRIKHDGSTFVPSSKKTIINWGASTQRFPERYSSCRVINKPEMIDTACDKVKAFNAFRAANVSIPEFTNSRQVALEWVQSGKMVFARTQLKAHSGRGIVIMDPDHPDTWENLGSCQLFVKYIPKKDEYRIHVFNGEIIDIQRKGLRAELQGTEGVNFKIRNLGNGFVYTRNDNDGNPLLTSSSVPQRVKEVGKHAVAALGLDFGAADVIYNQKSDGAYALEVNCAPGLSGTTVTNYAQAFRSLI